MPALIVDRKSKRVIDGFNRLTRALRYGGEGATIEVCWRDYKSERDMLLDSFHLNSAHGLKFTTYDLARCITISEGFKLKPAEVAAALHLTVERLENIRLRKTALDSKGRLVPIKRTLAAFAGRRISAAQIEANRRAVGHHQVFLVNQVINLIEGGILDAEDETLLRRLEHLAALLTDLFAHNKKKSA